MCSCCHCQRQLAENNSDVFRAIRDLADRQQQLTELLVSALSSTTEGQILLKTHIDQGFMNRLNATPFIVGGPLIQPTFTDTFPECCVIGTIEAGMRVFQGGETVSGSGVLIHPRMVLTAAHIERAKVVALNVLDIESPTQNTEFIEARRIPYPDPRHDLALLILHEKAKTLPQKLATSEQINQAKEITIVGFGTEKKSGSGTFGKKRIGEKVTIRSLERANGNNESPDLGQLLGYNLKFEFTAWGSDPFVSNCEGDSGGPAYIITPEGNKFITGITKGYLLPDPLNPFAPKCGKGGVYTRVDKHLEWIKKVAKECLLEDIDKYLSPA